VLVTHGTENNDAAVANGDKNKMTEQDMKQNTKRYANEKKKKITSTTSLLCSPTHQAQKKTSRCADQPTKLNP